MLIPILTSTLAYATLWNMTKHTKIDLKQLAEEVSSMNSRKQIYQIIKRELKKQGHWKDRERGNPSKGYRIMKEHKYDK